MLITIGWSTERGYWLNIHIDGMDDSNVYTVNIIQMIRFLRMMMRYVPPVSVMFHHTMTTPARNGLIDVFKDHGIIS